MADLEECELFRQKLLFIYFFVSIKLEQNAYGLIFFRKIWRIGSHWINQELLVSSIW